MSTKEAAAILQVTVARVRQLIGSGQLRSTKIGRDHLIVRDDVERFDKHERRSVGRPRKLLR